MLALSQVDQTVDTIEVLDSGVEQLREEHVVLQSKLTEFIRIAKSIKPDGDAAHSVGLYETLRQDILVYMEALNGHSEWEDKVLFPMIAEYTGKDMGPIAVMEKEHELAKQHVTRFLEAMENPQALTDGERNREAVSFLLQAHTILTDHFKKEEEWLFPLAEQMLADFELFFTH